MAINIGTRVHVIGNSCAGKSTLAAKIAARRDLTVVELDALNWLPDWHGLNEHDPDRLRRRIREATAGDHWIVAGSYMHFSQECFWDRLQTLIWLDLPRAQLLFRVVQRSWKRWRSQELLWGTNRESFWQQFKVWEKEDSLIWWIWTQHARKQKELGALREDPRWQHIQIIRLSSRGEIDRFLDELSP